MTLPTTVPAPPRPPYATHILGREEGVFKPHTTIGNMKNAIHARTQWNRDAGVFEFDVEIGVYTLRGEDYVLWLTLDKGASPSKYPVLFRR